MSGHTQVDGPTEPTDLHKTEVNKQLVARFVEHVLINGEFDNVTDYVSTESYIQHSPRIADGIDGLDTFMSSLPEHGRSIAYEEVHKVIGCGNFVATLSRVNLAGTGAAVIDLFRVDNDRIVEHWDVTEVILPVDEWVNSGKF